MSGTFSTTEYEGQKNQVSWHGINLSDNADFKKFVSEDVTSRLRDTEGREDCESHLRSLSLTGFGKENLEEVLQAEIEEDRDWAVGEAFAEAWLDREYNITWPWNMERDKRNPYGSLPGADLVGFHHVDDETRLLLGEVKTSTEEKYPPSVMKGRSGMIHQIDNLSTNLGLIATLVRWMWVRCKNTEYQESFDAAVIVYFESGNKAVSLFGVLVRDTNPNELDLKNRGRALGRNLIAPATCRLIAVYLPCTIDDLRSKVAGGDDT